jgi:hypothetical protein
MVFDLHAHMLSQYTYINPLSNTESMGKLNMLSSWTSHDFRPTIVNSESVNTTETDMCSIKTLSILLSILFCGDLNVDSAVKFTKIV